MIDRPNILFMHSHNTGTYIEPYGHAVPTPHIQRLAEQGVLFRRAYATAPTCSPSRASFLTGMYPHSCGMTGLAHRGFAMSNYDWHAARIFKTNGYFTATAGVEHTAPDLNTIGYDKILSGHKLPRTAQMDRTRECRRAFLKKRTPTTLFHQPGLKRNTPAISQSRTKKISRRTQTILHPPSPLTRHTRNASRHSRLQSIRPHNGQPLRQCTHSTSRNRPGRQHPRMLLCRPRIAISAQHVQPDRPRHWRVPDHTRTGRI